MVEISSKTNNDSKEATKGLRGILVCFSKLLGRCFVAEVMKLEFLRGVYVNSRTLKNR